MSARVPVAVGLAALLISASAAAQQSTVHPDSARAHIQATLRAFYFNLAHHDWEALTADILAAKVVAHRPAPESLMLAARAPGDAPACASSTAARVDQAAILLERDWAEAWVPQCAFGSTGADQFRLIRFEERWRLVSIRLLQEEMSVSATR